MPCSIGRSPGAVGRRILAFPRTMPDAREQPPPSDALLAPAGWRQEGRDLMAAVAGGAIVGMPLLYTMEMWYHGMTCWPCWRRHWS
jgi:hypothetical protein